MSIILFRGKLNIGILIRNFWLIYLVLLNSTKSLGQSERQIGNLKTFSQLYGYVRWFHPTSEASKIDWEKFASYGCQQVENAKSDEELQKILTHLFSPIAPNVIICKRQDSLSAKNFIKSPEKPDKYAVTYWQHNGVGLTGGNNINYSSARVNSLLEVNQTNLIPFGSIGFSIDVNKFIGKDFRLTADVKIAGNEGSAQLWARVENRINDTEGFFKNMDSNPIVKRRWNNYELEGQINEGADNLNFGIFLDGKGEVNIDNLKLFIKDSVNSWQLIYQNIFEYDSTFPSAMSVSANAQNFYSYTLEKKETYFLTIKSRKVYSEFGKDYVITQPLFKEKPVNGQSIKESISDSLYCYVPLCLYTDLHNTYPVVENKLFKNLYSELQRIQEFDLSNKYNRLAVILVCWNTFQHFYPLWEYTSTDWSKDFDLALKNCYENKNGSDLLLNLKEMTAKLKDGHLAISYLYDEKQFMPEIRWELIENKLIITDILNENLPIIKGSIVDSINGVPSNIYYSNNSRYVSSATDGYLNKRLNAETLIGEKNTSLMINITTPQGEAKSYELRRNLSYLDFHKKLNNKSKTRVINDSAIYLNLVEISQLELDSIMPQLLTKKGIICDLRGYPKVDTELLNRLLPIDDTCSAWMFTPRFISQSHKSISYQVDNWINFKKMHKPHINAKVIFLTDASAISYSESYLGFVKHYKLGIIVGQPTAGTNGNVNKLVLFGHYVIPFTGMKVTNLNGSRFHGIGILPDVYVHKTIKGIRNNKDEFLDKAIELLKE